MQSNPVVSEFSLEGQTPPQILIRSQLRDPPPNPTFSRSACGQREMLINVRPANPPSSSSQLPLFVPGGNIRADIDACLQAVQVAYANRQNKPQQNFIPLQHSRLQQEPIHRIDGNIVMDYVATVYRDYRIRNRFGDFDPKSLGVGKKGEIIKQVRVERKERNSGINDRVIVREVRQERQERPSSVSRQQKQFLNVTQQSKINRRDASFSSHKKQGLTFADSKQHRHTFSSHESPVNLIPFTSRLPPQSTTKRSQVIGRVREDSRYCVNCEKSILSINVDFHQQYQCKNFEQLYRLTFRQLFELVQGKTQRMREELRAKVRGLRQADTQGRNRAEGIASSMVNLIENYVREDRVEVQNMKDQIREEQRRLKYNIFMESQNNLYAEAIQLTHKLHWFQQISYRLRKEQQQTHETTTKTQQGKAMQYIRSLATPAQKAMKSELSPVSYFHPHLHRLSKPI